MLPIPSVFREHGCVPFGIPASAIGLVVSGDVAGMTIYTDRFMRKVWFPQAPPKCPPTDMQRKQRWRFVQAMADWSAQTDQVKADWEQITKRASLVMTGHNLWVSVSLGGTFDALNTLRNQTGVWVDDPPWIPWPEDVPP